VVHSFDIRLERRALYAPDSICRDAGKSKRPSASAASMPSSQYRAPPRAIAVAITLAIIALGVGAFPRPRLGPSCAQDLERSDPRFRSAAESGVRERSDKIRAEIASLGIDHAWAGSYYQGDGLGMNVMLRIAPTAGFVFEWRGCMGLSDRNFGTVKEADGRIALSFQFPNKRVGLSGLAPEFIPIRWGDRRYLVALDQIESFCADTNSGDEPRRTAQGQYLMRDDDQARSASGLPSVPAKYSKLLLKAPVQAKVIEVLDSWKEDPTTFMTRVKIDAGSEQGLVEGVRLYLIEPSRIQALVIEKVSPQSSVAIVERRGPSAGFPKIGWKFSSKITRG
jgi:hypothetical protein